MNIQQILLSAFLGTCFLPHGTVRGAPIAAQMTGLVNVFTGMSYTPVPTKVCSTCE